MFSNVIKIGMLTQKTLSDIEHLERDVAMWVMIHNLNERLSSKSSKKNGNQYAHSLITEIDPKIVKINEQIVGLNKIATILGTELKVVKIQKKDIKYLVKARFDVVAGKESIDLNNENFNLKLSQFLMITRKSLIDYIDSMDRTKQFKDLKKISKNYCSQLENAIDISSMGIHDVSVFTAGRTVEDVINRYIRALMKNKKMQVIQLKNYKFDAKIGLLKKQSFIDDKLYHDLSSVRISRNDTGHPKRAAYNQKGAFEAVSQAISIIVKVEKRIKLVNKTYKNNDTKSI